MLFANVKRPISKLEIAKGSVGNSFFFAVKNRTKETTLERADFAIQLLLFVTVEKEEQMFTIFFLSIFLSAVVPAV